jgi:chemotaxis protein methyltransferase CheR
VTASGHAPHGQAAGNSPATNDIERFRAAIVAQTGLHFDDARLDFLSEVLQRRLGRLGSSATHYLDRLEDGHAQGEFKDELNTLARDLTVGETYFFRHNDQFRAFAEVALPERMRVRDGSKTLQLLSAGCASGEEAYSLAIVARTVVEPSWTVGIRAIDLNPAVLEKAARGRYSTWALREASADIQQKWFHPDSRDLILSDSVRGAVEFSLGNLASDDPMLWQPALYDVIFCRNVLMYFAPYQMRAAVGRLAASLAPGGYLFLGHAETLRGVSDDFHLCHTHETFYYQRKDKIGAAPAFDDPAGYGAPNARPDQAPVQTAAFSTGWVEAIQQASERVALLVATAKTSQSEEQAKGWELKPALDLLRHERFGEALDYVRSGPSETESDPDVLLVKAMLLAHSGEIAEAESACQRLLAADELNAGAHYVLALCREHCGDRVRAVEHDRIAAHLDPGFAMPRLHWGLLMRQAGDRDGARRELQHALVLLKREDVSRLLLFGGGFTRDALIALCQSAASECGGLP